MRQHRIVTSDEDVRLTERIAAAVRAELARQQKTQREAAAIIGQTQQAVQVRLAGKRSFRAEELAKLAEALGVPVTRFIPETASSQTPTPGTPAPSGPPPGPTGPTPTGPGRAAA
jgi:transcriptional regulator with XRE-family HTH domain